jgi:predicted nuclease of predicted toxin-antitoxin system
MKLFNYQCVGNTANTGIPNCTWTPKNITGAILLPKGKEYTKADIAVMWTTLQADVKADSPTARIYPVLPFKAVTDNSTEVQIETDGYGGKTFVRDGDYDFTFMYKNGHCFYQKLRTFHTKHTEYTVAFIDEINNVLWGTTSTNGNFTGFSLEMLIVPNMALNTGDAATKYFIRFAMEDATEMNDLSYVIQLPKTQPLMRLSGLIDITLTEEVALNGTGAVGIGMTYNCDNQYLGDLYPTEIVELSIWSAVNKATGASIDIDTITYNATTKLLTLDMDDADLDYPSSGGVITITLGDISDMEAEDIFGFAGASLDVVVP